VVQCDAVRVCALWVVSCVAVCWEGGGRRAGKGSGQNEKDRETQKEREMRAK